MRRSKKSHLSLPPTVPGPGEAGKRAPQRLNAKPDHQRHAHKGQKSSLSKERERARDSKQLLECLVALCKLPERQSRFEYDYTKKLARPEPYLNAVGVCARFIMNVDLSAEALSVTSAGLQAEPLAGGPSAAARACSWDHGLTFQDFRAYLLEFLPDADRVRVAQCRNSR